MVFLVDYENVGESGLKGIEVLNNHDRIVIFYSKGCKRISVRSVHMIERANCEFEIIALRTQGKNALDYYIAAYIGELLGSNCTQNMAIISKDKGFQAVCDYVKIRMPKQLHIYFRQTIESAIISMNEPDERTRQLNNDVKQMELETFYAIYQERQRMKKRLEELLMETPYAGEMDHIYNMMVAPEHTPKVVYLNSLRQFGRKNGLEIYRLLKNAFYTPQAETMDSQ